jgi:hypothetical protein
VRETRREPRRAPTCHLMMGRQLNEAISSLIPSLGSVRATAEADSRTRSVLGAVPAPVFVVLLVLAAIFIYWICNLSQGSVVLDTLVI